jgi:hypothetical protein
MGVNFLLVIALLRLREVYSQVKVLVEPEILGHRRWRFGVRRLSLHYSRGYGSNQEGCKTFHFIIKY